MLSASFAWNICLPQLRERNKTVPGKFDPKYFGAEEESHSTLTAPCTPPCPPEFNCEIPAFSTDTIKPSRETLSSKNNEEL